MDVTIRPATGADLAAADELARDAVGVPQPQSRYIISQSDRNVLVAEKNSQIVGMVSAGPPSSKVAGFDERGRRIDLSKAPWWKVYALAVTAPREGVATALLREVHKQLPRRIRGLYGNVHVDRASAIAFYRSNGFYLAPSLENVEGPGGRSMLMEGSSKELYFIAPRQRLFQPPEQWEERNADQLMLDQIKTYARLRQRSDAGYRTWLRSFTPAPAACGHDQLGPRPLITLAYDPEHRTWCTSCKVKGIELIARHPLMNEDETRCDLCGRIDPTTAHGWAHDESRRLIGMAYLCAACRAA